MVSHQSRKTLAKSIASAAPLRVLLYTLPLWGMSFLLLLFMPITGFITLVIVAICLFILPFTAKSAACPACTKLKLFPFSGFGSSCRGCGKELVLRGKAVHLLADKSGVPRAGSGRNVRQSSGS